MVSTGTEDAKMVTRYRRVSKIDGLDNKKQRYCINGVSSATRQPQKRSRHDHRPRSLLRGRHVSCIVTQVLQLARTEGKVVSGHQLKLVRHPRICVRACVPCLYRMQGMQGLGFAYSRPPSPPDPRCGFHPHERQRDVLQGVMRDPR